MGTFAWEIPWRIRLLIISLVTITISFSVSPVAESTQIDPDILWDHMDHPDLSVHLQRLSDFAILFPTHPNAASAMTLILDGSRHLPCVQALRLLDDMEAVLQENPVRPMWHVYAARAQTRWGPGTDDVGCPTSSPLIYTKLLWQVIDSTKPDDFYVRHPYDAKTALLLPGLDIPVFTSWDTDFVHAVNNKVTGEPIHAQLLIEIATTYEDLGMWSEAKLAYEQYLKTYFPMWRSNEVWARVKDYDRYVLHRQAGTDVLRLLQSVLDHQTVINSSTGAEGSSPRTSR